jgi:hypothetical protein
MIVLHAAQRATFVDWNPTGEIITIPVAAAQFQ